MSMLDAGERTRPIMQYVHDLETAIRRYRQREMRFHAWWFGLGLFLGAAAMSATFLLMRALHRG